MTNLWIKFYHRCQTSVTFIGWLAQVRPWVLPIFIGLLLLTGLVSLAQATHVAPLIYTLF